MDYSRYNSASDAAKPAAPIVDAEAGAVFELRQEVEALKGRSKRHMRWFIGLLIFVALLTISFLAYGIHFGREVEKLESAEGAGEGVGIAEGVSSEGARTAQGAARVGVAGAPAAEGAEGEGTAAAPEGEGGAEGETEEGAGEGLGEGVGNEATTEGTVGFSRSAVPPEDWSRVGTLFGGNGYWSPRAVMPQALAGQYHAAWNGSVFLMGGTTRDVKSTNAVYMYDGLLDQYFTMPSLPFSLARGAAAFDAKNKKLVITGGKSNYTFNEETKDNDGTVFKCTLTLDLSKYDPKKADKSSLNATTWKQGACMSVPRNDHCAVAIDGFVYVFGGHAHTDGSSSEEVKDEYTTVVERYDVANDKWEKMSWSLPHGAADVACAVASNGRVYIAGGENEAEAVGEGEEGTTEEGADGVFEGGSEGAEAPEGVVEEGADGVFEGTGEGEEGKEGAAAPEGAEGAEGEAEAPEGADGVFEGTGEGESEEGADGVVEGQGEGEVAAVGLDKNFLTQVIEVDVKTGNVTKVAEMPWRRAYVGLVALPNNRLMTLGGEFTYYGDRAAVAYSEVAVYHISRRAWELRPRLPQPRFRHAAVYAYDAVHVFGGQTSCSADTELSCGPYKLDSHITLVDMPHIDLFVHAKNS